MDCGQAGAVPRVTLAAVAGIIQVVTEYPAALLAVVAITCVAIGGILFLRGG